MTRGDLMSRTLELAFQWLTCGPDGRVLALLVRLIRSVRFFLAVAVLSLVFPGVPLGNTMRWRPTLIVSTGRSTPRRGSSIGAWPHD